MQFNVKTRGAGARRLLAWVGLVSLAALTDEAAAQTYLPRLGGPGGGQFTDLCPAGMNLTGVELRAGDDVDAIRSVCAPSYGKTSIGAQRVAPDWHGGNGGRIEPLHCPPKAPIISGIGIESEGVDTVIVNSISLFCGAAGVAQPTNVNPSAVFEGPAYVPSRPAFGVGISGDPASHHTYRQDCPAGQVAIGLHGRSGRWLDALGLVCDLPRMSSSPGIALGRLGPPSKPGSTSVSTCEAAKAARARQSPAAANLEAQCRVQTPVSSIGRSAESSPAGGAPESICDRAASARDRKSLAAASLEAQCRQLGGHVPEPASGGPANLEDLMAKGEAMAGNNALAAELRARQTAGPIRQGFDIGLAVTDGDTAWGPGKQKALESLSPPQQEGFKLAASLAMDQNRHAELAKIGAALAEGDPPLARARARETDPRFHLGFDIASGLFGDPALGATGNTASGPGSLRIRDALSAVAQRGFNASMQLHLSRRY